MNELKVGNVYKYREYDYAIIKRISKCKQYYEIIFIGEARYSLSTYHIERFKEDDFYLLTNIFIKD